MIGRFSRLDQIEASGEGLVLVPFNFRVPNPNSGSPTELHGDSLVSVTRLAAGKWECVLREKPRSCFFGFADVSFTADGTDLIGRVDWSTVSTDRKIIVRTMTGTTQTDPTAGLYVGGYLLVKKVRRRARRRAA